MEDFRKVIKKYKEEQGLNDAEFERRGGLKSGYYRDMMKREHVQNPGLPKMIALCKAVGKRPDQIFSEIRDLYSKEALELLDELEEINKRKSSIREKLNQIKG